MYEKATTTSDLEIKKKKYCHKIALTNLSWSGYIFRRTKKLWSPVWDNGRQKKVRLSADVKREIGKLCDPSISLIQSYFREVQNICPLYIWHVNLVVLVPTGT